MPAFAFYDLDRTVTRLPTWSAFLIFAAKRRFPWRIPLATLVLPAAVAHRAGLISRDRLKEIMHSLLIGRSVSAATIAVLAEQFADRVVAQNVRPGAREQIRADQADGFRVVLATAAHRFYAEPIGRRLGIADIVATRAITSTGGRLSSRLDGSNLYGEAKLAAIRKWLLDTGTPREMQLIRFYTDHVSDAPSLEFADEPFVVNPHGRLRDMAKEKGWPLLDWNTRSPNVGKEEHRPCAQSS